MSATTISALGGRHVIYAVRGQLDYLSDLVKAAREADVSSIRDVAMRGRPKNERATAVASIIIDVYEKLTGDKADLPANRGGARTRGLIPLVKAIFAVLRIRAHPKAAVTAALSSRHHKLPEHALKVHRGQNINSEEFWERLRLRELDQRSPKYWKRDKNTPSGCH
jgi:hypothetical protein